MSSNSNIELVNLDFATLKNSLKKYLANQDKFSDYDFDGSNMSVLLDLLAYNTYINSYYLNMVTSEMFLDSAQLRESVLSHAKELNYLPRSFQSASARVNLIVTPTTSVNDVTLLKGTSFTSRIGDNTFSFVVDENLIQANNVAGTFTFSDVDIFEGELISETFVFNSNTILPQVVISNPTVDLRSLEVFVYEDNGETILNYTKGTTFLGLVSNSQVYFVQPARNDLYEIVFGNGTQGRQPKDGSTIVVGYRACSGELPNGAAVFSTNDTIDGHANIQVTTVSFASGGLVHESLQSIKKNAPRAFQTQERAVTASDYKIILQTNFPEIESISVFGGENADPPQYGKVFISVDVTDSDGVPQFKKDIYREFIRTVTPLSIDPVFINPEFMYLEINSIVRYNLNNVSITENNLKTLIENKIQIFNELNLDDFDVTFRYSKLVSDIDSVDSSILSNQTNVALYKEITPLTSEENTYTLNFYNSLDNRFLEALPAVHRSQEFHSVMTTPFIFDNQTCMIADDHAGILNIYAISGTNHVLIKPIGTVNYQTGRVLIAKFQPSSYPAGSIRVKVRTRENDVNALRNNILRIKTSDINVFVVSNRGGSSTVGSSSATSGSTASDSSSVSSPPPSSLGGGGSFGY